MSKAYYAIIPAYIRYDEELCANAKLMYGEITALTNEYGNCYATNEYFAELYSVSRVSISKWINSLIKKGYLDSDIIYSELTHQVIGRVLKLPKEPVKEKFNTPIKEKFNTPPYKNGVITTKILKDDEKIDEKNLRKTKKADKEKIFLEENKEKRSKKENKEDIFIKEINKEIKRSYIAHTHERENEVEIVEKTPKEEFEELWKLYPNKQGKINAQKKYLKYRNENTTYEEVKEGLISYLKYIENKKILPQFIKHGSTWFNQKCWLDEYKTEEVIETNEFPDTK